MSEAPVIETARLRLRGHRVEDAALTAALWADADVTRFIGGRPFTQEESWSRLLRYVGHWALMGFGYWVVEEKDSGAFVGEIGFADYRRDITPSLGDAPEIGWVLSPSAHGKGYATEAVNAALAWGDRHFAKRHTVCIIAPDNQASRRVAEKCGYREIRRTTYKDHPTIVFAR
ncbi:GNAT family N-acetyltransferase [Terrarubrum flagellatum]|uniref:GNAT family N-acetyltransferase n=1 Tax=Terrirubrum flagellatum TaxID=2895980 RepID=UPI0031455764